MALRRRGGGSAQEGGTLTRRASLTLGAGLLRQGTRTGLGLVTTPFVIRGLGVELYGAWAVIQRSVALVALCDLQAMSTLKFRLAVEHSTSSDSDKRRAVGAAVTTLLLTYPLLAAVGAVAVWTVPTWLPTSSQAEVRIALAVALVGVALERIASFGTSVLRGENLDYKARTLDTTTLLVGGAAIGVVAGLGYGIVGVAVASAAATLLYNLARCAVAARSIPWLGVERPTWPEIRRFTGLSGWLMLGKLSHTLLMVADVLLAGLLLGPTAAGQYAATAALLRLASGPIGEVLAAGGPGLAMLCGSREFARVSVLRDELVRVALGVMTAVGVGVLLINEAFLGVWAGPGLYAGDATNLALVVGALIASSTAPDVLVTDAMLAYRTRALITTGGAAATIVLSVPLATSLGTEGIAVASAVGHAAVLVALLCLLAAATGRRWTAVARPSVRPAAVAIAILAAAAALSRVTGSDVQAVLVAVPAVLLAAVLWAWLGLAPRDRRALVSRLRQALPGERRLAEDA